VGGPAQPLVGGPAVTDDGGGLDDDPVSGQARGAGELQAVTEGTQPRGDATDLLPHGAVDEGTGRFHGQKVAGGGVLGSASLRRKPWAPAPSAIATTAMATAESAVT